MTLENAKELARCWVETHMVPPWPAARFESEWRGLLNADLRNHGPMPEDAPTAPAQAQDMPQFEQNEIVERIGAKYEPIESVEDLLSWDVDDRSDENPTARIDLVENLIVAGQPHIFVAEGGAGKTMLALDLGLKIAASARSEGQLFWMGQPITREAAGASVVMFTAEDNQAALNRRWAKIDPGKRLRKLAKGHLIVVPMQNTGQFKLNTRDKNDSVAPTREWANRLKLLAEMQQRGHNIRLVVIDTLNTTLNGDESSSADISDYMSMITELTSKLGAAVIIVHHVRKPTGKDPRNRITDGDDMLDAIRGSAAIKDNVRVAIGIWRAPDYRKKLPMMGLPAREKTLYCAEIVKCNEPMMEGTRFLLKNPDSGLLEDVTIALRGSIDMLSIRQRAWIRFAVAHYAERGLFFSKTGRSGVHEQRARFHPDVQKMTKPEMWEMFEAMVDSRVLIKRGVEGLGNMESWYDVREAVDEVREVKEKGTAVPTIDYREWVFDPHEMDIAPAWPVSENNVAKLIGY